MYYYIRIIYRIYDIGGSLSKELLKLLAYPLILVIT